MSDRSAAALVGTCGGTVEAPPIVALLEQRERPFVEKNADAFNDESEGDRQLRRLAHHRNKLSRPTRRSLNPSLAMKPII